MTDRPKLLLLLPHLGGGGAERVMARLAQGLSQEKYDIHLALVTETGIPVDAVGPGVTVHTCGAKRVRKAGPRLLRLVRRLHPDLIVSGMFHLNFLVLLLRPLFPAGTLVLVRQNGTVSASLADDCLPLYTRLLYRVLYRRADRVICQSAAMASDLARTLRLDPDRIAVLLNPVDVDGIRSAAQASPCLWSSPGPHLLAVGRLAVEKGFDLLLDALACVREQFPHCDLVIAGAGHQEAALRAQCHRLGLESAVHFAGQVELPAAYFPGATLFVLSSRHEGMPNALLEAAAAGLPLVATPASPGLIDLLDRQPGAWLAEEISAGALGKTLNGTLNALRPGERFAHHFIQDFRTGSVVDAYEALLDAMLRRNRR